MAVSELRCFYWFYWKAYPAMPPASILFASVTSLLHTSYCHFFKPRTPHSTLPVWSPTRMLRLTSVDSHTDLENIIFKFDKSLPKSITHTLKMVIHCFNPFSILLVYTTFYLRQLQILSDTDTQCSVIIIQSWYIIDKLCHHTGWHLLIHPITHLVAVSKSILSSQQHAMELIVLYLNNLIN